MARSTLVHNWRYDNGYYEIPTVLRKESGPTKEFRKEYVGWHCWVYPEDNQKFSNWMKENMQGKYDCTYRFNSGDPMWTVFIENAEDATLFKIMFC